MPTFFEARIANTRVTMTQADSMAAVMDQIAKPLGIRILALRRLAGGGVLFAGSARRTLPLGTLTARLEQSPLLSSVDFGEESREPPSDRR